MALEPSSQSYQWTFRRVMWATLVFIFIALSFWLIYRSGVVIFILFTALVIGTVIRPAVNWLYAHGVSRMVGAILVYLLLFVLLVGLLLLLLPLIAEQSGKIVTLIPTYYQNLRVWMMQSSDPLIAQLGESLPTYLTIPMLAQQTSQQILESGEQGVNLLAPVLKIVVALLVLPFIAYYWTLYGPRVIQSLLLLVPVMQREHIRELVYAMEAKVSAYIAAQSFLCLVIGVMALIAYLLIGLPNALALALVAGLFEAVPLIGPLLGAIPAAAVALSVDPSKVVWVILATIVIQQLENSLLVPRVMRKSVGVNPFVTLLSLFAFSTLLGIPGALMAIPIAAILQLLLDHFVFDAGLSDPEVSDGRDYASRLRYEAQDLAQDLRKQARLKKGGSDVGVHQVDQVLDEIEAITTDLDALLAQSQNTGER